MNNQEMLEAPFDKVTDVSVSVCASVPKIRSGEKILSVTYEGGYALLYRKVEELYEMESVMHDFLKPFVASVVRKT